MPLFPPPCKIDQMTHIGVMSVSCIGFWCRNFTHVRNNLPHKLFEDPDAALKPKILKRMKNLQLRNNWAAFKINGPVLSSRNLSLREMLFLFYLKPDFSSQSRSATNFYTVLALNLLIWAVVKITLPDKRHIGNHDLRNSSVICLCSKINAVCCELFWLPNDLTNKQKTNPQKRPS